MDSRRQQTEEFMLACPHSENVLKVVDRLKLVSSRKCLSPPAAGRLAGQLEFLGTKAFRRVGRSSIGSFRVQQYSNGRCFRVSGSLLSACKMLICLLTTANRDHLHRRAR